MAKKRKISKSETTPTSKSEPGSQPESEPGSQPESEPMDEAPTINGEEPPQAEETLQAEPESVTINGEEPPQAEETLQAEPESVEEEASAEVEENPQTQENNDPNPAEEDSEEEEDPSSFQKILELFPKDQLVDLLRSAAAAHPDVLSAIHRAADADPAHRKIFVHGLGWDTSAESLTAFFSQYGEIEDCKAVTDKLTGKSKGYAFILFKSRRGARNALKEPQKNIGGRLTACQLASLGPVPPPTPQAAQPMSESTQRKIYVSNVGAELEPQKLIQFFSEFGEIEEGPLGLDKTTGKPRGFCLFVYKSAESAKKALEKPHKNFEGHTLHCQKAVDGPKGNKQFNYGKGPRPNTGFIGGGAPSGGHLMAPSGGGLGFNQSAPPAAVPGLNPALNQALTTLLANQGAAGLGLPNVMGGLGSAGPVMNQWGGAPMGNTGMQGGYGNQGFGGYGYPQQGGYGNAQMGRGRGRPPFMGRK